jgi:hypothetical protein
MHRTYVKERTHAEPKGCMPTILKWNGYRFFFFSNEGDPQEPVHVHVRKGESVAKIWLDPEISVAHAWGLTSKELSRLCTVTADNAGEIRRKWNEYFDY